MTLCKNKLKAGILPNCNNAMFGGYAPIGYIINKEDITSVVYDEKGVVTTLTLNVTTTAFSLQQEGNQPFKTNSSVTIGDGRNNWTNNVQVIGGANNASFFNDVVKPLASGSKYVVILEKLREVDDESAFIAYGLEKGLSLADGANCEEYGETTNGSYNLPLEEVGAPNELHFVKLGLDREATRTKLNAMLMLPA